MCRIKVLRARLGWSQSQMASRLGLSQSRVSHLESGRPESRPVSLLLDMLEKEVAAGLPCGASAAGDDAEGADSSFAEEVSA